MNSIFKKIIQAPSMLRASLFSKSSKPVTQLFQKGISDSVGPSLHDVLKNSYATPSVQAKFGADKGYVFDNELSNHNQQVYHNPTQNKLLVSVTGTHNLHDAITDARLLAGGLKNTDRYKQAQNTLQQAKSKYGVDSATIAGHSLGGSIGSYIAGSKDKVLTLDKGQTIGNRNNVNEQAFRSAGDVVSLLGANKMKTIGSGSILTGGLSGALNAHNISNIKDANIFV